MIFETIDHTTTGVDRLTYKLKQSNIETLLSLFLAKKDEIEEAFTAIGGIKDVNTTTGIWLDYLGKLVGEDRNNLEDEDYRVMLKRKIAINTADGTPDSIMSLVSQYTDATGVSLTESGMAFGTVSIKEGENLSSGVYDLIQTIKPAATRWLVHSDIYDNAFKPAYENNTYEPELFYVTTDGTTYDNLKTTVNGTNFSNFYIVKEGQCYYEDTVYATRNTLHYEGDTGDDSYPRAILEWEIGEGSDERTLTGYSEMLLYNDRFSTLTTTFEDEILRVEKLTLIGYKSMESYNTNFSVLTSSFEANVNTIEEYL